MMRLCFLLCALIATLLQLLLAGSLHAADDRPNLILITSDDHRWDALGAAGNPAVHTPHLDALAREGIHFLQATTSVSQCLPIRASLLTGLAAHGHGALSHGPPGSPEPSPPGFDRLPTLPGLLRAAGYHTVMVGKWHLALDPWKAGFAETRRWFSGGGQQYHDPELQEGECHEPKVVKGYLQELLADSALSFLDSPAAREKPFLLWLAFTAPHTPFAPNPDHIARLYADKKPAELLPPGFPPDIPTNDWRHYLEAVTHLDEQIGRLLTRLERSGLAGRTVVVFAGDNGFMMGERGLGASGANGKIVPYESSLRVPLIVRAPGFQGFQGRSEAALSLLDLPPTLLALAGLTPPSKVAGTFSSTLAWPGRNALPALRERAAAGFEDAFSEWADDQSERFKKLAHRLVRTRSHKLIVWQDPSQPPELYDLLADPREAHNLFGQPAAAAIQRDLWQRLNAWLERTADPARGWPQVRH